MIVYAETVFISNFFIDLFLTAFTAAVLKRNCPSRRLILSALIGAAFSTVYPVIGNYRYALKFACAIIMSVIITPGKKFVDNITVLFTFCVSTFILGGLVMFFIDFSGKRLTYEDFTYGFVPIVISISCLIIIRFADVMKKQFLKTRQKNSLYYAARIKSGVYEKKCRAFYDSGNRVYANNGEPVIFVSDKIYNELNGEESETEIITAVGKKRITLRRTDLEIYFPDGTNIIYKVSAGSLSVPCFDADILLHSDMLGDNL